MKSIAFKTAIALIFSLLFATQANAYDITTTVSPTGASWEWGNGTIWRQAYSNSVQGEVNCGNITGDAIFWAECVNNSYNNTWVLKQIQSSNLIAFLEGRYYKTQIVINISNGAGDWRNAWEQVPQLNRLVIPSGRPYKLVSIEPIETTCFINGAIRQIPATTTGEIWSEYYESCKQGSITYDIIVQATETMQTYMILGDGSSWFLQSSIGINTGGIRRGTIRPLTITEYKPENATAVNDQQQQAGEQAQTDGQNASNQAQQQTDQQTATAFQTIGNILGAITDTPAGDCSITGDMGNINMGNLNLCQAEIEPIRPIIRAVLYLVMALATYKIMMWVLGSIAGLINWVQTGNEGKEENG